ncbi:hypothetical protein F2Q68_00024347 [Brassica cretica]|uniref:BZIP domain-containing protein n=1 Tax=Brassica cretica TaxID=69181 RepID=A0A8S9IBB2_BRACR|nr:hypothetical protein F2Q68_00024347 [Brassica cretica]
MVGRETEMMSEREVETSTAQARHNGGAGGGGGENHPFSSLGRQSSIYSLTLDEFQHALCENGKNFGSMNMDEFLVSIWNAEENNNNNHQAAAAWWWWFFRKTVEEVWSEIRRGGGDNNNGRSTSSSNGQNNANNGVGESAARQPTFGEMTLEDFLVKAGVVREHPTNPKPMLNPTPTSVIPASIQQQQLYGVFPGGGDPTFPVGVGDYGKRAGGGGGYQQAAPVQQGVCYGGGGGGFGAGGQQMGMVGPLSPVSSDGLGHGQVDNIGGQYGVDMRGLRGRKRVVDGPVEKVVERRQRRMIKNRESAARSRARKQAYTVELEAELNQLKEENAQLKHALGELERKRKQQYFESLKTRAQPKVPKVSGRLRTLMRNPSCPL